MTIIDDYIPIESITHLALADKAMWNAYATEKPRLPYFKAISAIHAAVHADWDSNKTRNALHAIKKTFWMQQPRLMRAFAEKAPGLAKIDPHHDLPEWDAMLTNIETLSSKAFGDEWRGPQLLDLCIAALHAQSLPFLNQKGWLLAKTSRLWMQAFPVSNRGDFMAAADALNMYMLFDDWQALLENAIPLSRPPTDKFARAIGLRLLDACKVTAPVTCLENLGVTRTQVQRIILPSCAVYLSRNIPHQPSAIKAQCKKWGIYAAQFAATVEASIDNDGVRQNNPSMLDTYITRDRDIVPKCLSEHGIAFVKKFECDVIQALGDDQTSVDAFLANWQFASTHLYTASDWVATFERLTAGTIPLVCQPALLDRLALSQLGNGGAATGIQGSAIGEWLNAAIALPAFHEKPKLLSRMYVAFIHALDQCSVINPGPTVEKQKQLVADSLQILPPSAWGWILELISEPKTERNFFATHLPFTTFVLDPHTSAHLPSRSFCANVIDAAADVWETLPDQAEGVRSKLANFCDRFGIPENAHIAAKKKILDRIVKRAAVGEFTLSEGLTVCAFDKDLGASRYAHQAFQYGINSQTSHPGFSAL
jgi:hypothetical protein